MTKTDRVFNALMEGKSFNRFEAERQLHDHCLHSTVATLERTRHIIISRKFETVKGFGGSPTRVCRYWIAQEERERINNRRQMPDKEKAPTATKLEGAFSNDTAE